MRNPFVFSFIVSLISLLLVFVSPFQITEVEKEKAAKIIDGKIYSPYREEVDRLLEEGKNGMTSVQLDEWEAAVDKNNKWFEEYNKDPEKFTELSSSEAWKKKSGYHAPVVALMWGMLFYIFYKSAPIERSLLVLVVPVFLTVAHLMPLVESVLIALAVLLVWFWFLLESRVRSENTP